MWVLGITQFVLSDASGPLRPLLDSHAVPLRAERARLGLLPEATVPPDRRTRRVRRRGGRLPGAAAPRLRTCRRRGRASAARSLGRSGLAELALPLLSPPVAPLAPLRSGVGSPPHLPDLAARLARLSDAVR